MPTQPEEPILRPISPDYPAGEDLRSDEAYDKIRKARLEDDASLPRGVWVSKLKQADWEFVADYAMQILGTRSKDLQIAAWLVEAMIHRDGFPGFNRGLYLFLGIAETFWETAFPGNPADDLESRLAPIFWLNEKTAHKLKFIPLVEIHSEKDRELTFASYEQQLRAADQKAAAPKSGNPQTEADFNSSLWTRAASTSNEFYVENIAAIEEALQTAAALEHFLQGKAGPEAPALHHVRTNLEACLGLMTRILENRGIPMEPTEPTPNLHPTPQASVSTGSARPGVPFTIQTRADAYRVLSEAADFLQRSEPHSPVPHLVRRALRWGHLSFEEMLPELVKNPSDLQVARELLDLHDEAPK